MKVWRGCNLATKSIDDCTGKEYHSLSGRIPKVIKRVMKFVQDGLVDSRCCLVKFSDLRCVVVLPHALAPQSLPHGV